MIAFASDIVEQENSTTINCFQITRIDGIECGCATGCKRNIAKSNVVADRPIEV